MDYDWRTDIWRRFSHRRCTGSTASGDRLRAQPPRARG